MVVHCSPEVVASGPATRRLGSASAISGAAASCACNSTAVNAGLATLSTPMAVPSSSVTMKFLSCWLPSDVACAVMP